MLTGIGNGFGAGIVQVLGADFAPAERRGEFLGVWRPVGDVGNAGGPFVVSFVVGIASLGLAAICTGGLGLAGAVLMWLVVPKTLSEERHRSEKPDPRESGRGVRSLVSLGLGCDSPADEFVPRPGIPMSDEPKTRCRSRVPACHTGQAKPQSALPGGNRMGYSPTDSARMSAARRRAVRAIARDAVRAWCADVVGSSAVGWRVARRVTERSGDDEAEGVCLENGAAERPRPTG